jgi:catechol 2,3-dioxygenase-like lactoylglutathione lyase family enzyme
VIDHVSIPVRDLASAGRFYDAVLQPLGLLRLVTREATIGFGKRYPEFWLNSRPDATLVENPGGHICLRAPNESSVRAFHAMALLHGATDEGAPGERQAAMTSYFGAFIIDPDGNKLETVTFPASPN